MVTEVISTDLLQKKNNKKKTKLWSPRLSAQTYCRKKIIKKKLSYGHRGYQHRLTAEKK